MLGILERRERKLLIMKIKEIRLRGWRSYSDEDGIVISDFKQINIIIGPNNAGKSNLFKYLYQIRETAIKIMEGKSEPAERDEFHNYDVFNHIIGSISKKDTWAEQGKDVICDLLIEDIQLSNTTSKASLHKNGENLHLRVSHNNSTCLSVMYNHENPLLELGTNKPRLLNTQTQNYVEAVRNIGFPQDTYTYWNNFFESLVFVDPIRHYDRASTPQLTSDFDGSSIIEDILKLHDDHDLAQEWRSYKNKIETWLKVILKEESFELDATGKFLRFFLNRGGHSISALLSDLGTGVSQLFMLLSYLFINRERSLNVLMEEPECNLHPEALIQFINILENEFTNHRFFISSHSSTLIDQVNENWSVNKVVRKGNSASLIQPCNKIIEKYELFDELGVRASQILQSNLIIWIEGPSDRIYLKKWINDHFQGIPIREGKHYSFMMYGGSNLSNYDIMAEDDFIDILSGGRYSIILCDSDKKDTTCPLKSRVETLKYRLETLKMIENGHERNISDFVKMHITNGREIENYISHDLFIKLFTGDIFKRIYFEDENDKRKNIICDAKHVTDRFGLFDSFDNYYTKLYRYEDGSELSLPDKKKLETWYSSIKTKIAKEAVNNWSPELYSVNGLNSMIKEIVDHIKVANNF